MRTDRTAVALATAAALIATTAPRPTASQTEPVRAHVRVIVLGDFEARWLPHIARALEHHLEVEATVEPARVPLPRTAYYPPRRRYRAERLTDFLVERFREAPATTRVLGLTRRDISTTAHGFRDWGILGLADDVPGRAAVVSSFRTHRRARDDDQARWRATTTAVHEMGHVLGLPHCTEPRCLMRDAEGTMDTVDASTGELGPSCRARLDRTAPRVLPRSAP